MNTATSIQSKEAPALQSKEPRALSLKLLAALFFGLIMAFHLGYALKGKSFERAGHLGTALEYARGSINLFRPIIVGFNATGTPTALEFPLWQAAAALVFKAAHSTWWGWANLTSLLLFATCLWPFLQLARQYVGERAAWWSLVFFLAQPIIIINAGDAATDGFSLVLIIWFLFFADKMIRSRNAVWWVPTAVFGALSAVTKLPFFMAAGLCSVFLLFINGPRAWRPWILLAAAGAFASVIFVLWTRYTNSLAAQAVYPFQELRLAYSPYIRWWYFGDLHYRLSPGAWIKGGWRFLHVTFGAMPLVILMIASLLRKGNLFPKAWLLATFLTTFVFTQIILAHLHYYLMCSPAVALLCGATLARWEPFFSRDISWPRLLPVLAAIVLILSAIDGIITIKVMGELDSYTADMSKIIHDYTQPTDKLIIFDSGFHPWGGETLFRSERNGLSVLYFKTTPMDPNTKGLCELLDNEKDLQRLKSLGYNKLILISESPVQFASQAINPGAKRERHYYPKSISPTVDNWPVVYQTDDILIKDIP